MLPSKNYLPRLWTYKLHLPMLQASVIKHIAFGIENDKGEQCDQIGRFIGLWTTLATINLTTSPTFLGNFCKGVQNLSFF